MAMMEMMVMVVVVVVDGGAGGDHFRDTWRSSTVSSQQEGCAGGDGDRFRGTRRSYDPTSPICHQAAPGPCWKSKSEFHQDVTVAGNYYCSFLGRSFTLKGFLKPEEFLSGLVC